MLLGVLAAGLAVGPPPAPSVRPRRAVAAVSAQDRYAAYLSLRPLVFVFPEQPGKADHLLLNTSRYLWRANPGVTMTRDGYTATITDATGGR